MTNASTELTLTDTEVETLAREFANASKPYLLFQSKENRDRVWRAVKHYSPFTEVVRGSSKNQLLDPRYTVEGSDIPDRGLANDYKHYFSTLYRLEKSRSW